MSRIFIIPIILLIYIQQCHQAGIKEITEFLNDYNDEGDVLQKKAAVADWDLETDMTDQSEEASEKIGGILNRFNLRKRNEAKKLLQNVEGDIPSDLLRQLKLIVSIEISSSSRDREKMSELKFKMMDIYEKNTVRKYRPEI